MSRCLLRGAARWLAAGALVMPALAPTAVAMPAEPPQSAEQPVTGTQPRATKGTAPAAAGGEPVRGPGTGTASDTPPRASGDEPARSAAADAGTQPLASDEAPSRGPAASATADAGTQPLTDAEARALRPCTPDARFAGLWPEDYRTVKFHATTLRERTAFAKLLPALLDAAPRRRTPPAGLDKVATSAGFRLEVWEGIKGVRDTFWVLREQPGKLRGAGAYVIRTGKATDDVVQVPHPWFDRGTEDIGVGLFACAPLDRQPRLFMTATAHRYQGNPGETPEDPEHPADVAHNPEHLFQEVTDLVARTLGNPRVLQLHGFGLAKSEEQGRDKDLVAVVSSGTRKPSAWARTVSERLVRLWGEGVRLYPEGAQVLGGTQNAQGRLLQAYECAHFLHLELSAQARKALTSGERLARLGLALFAPLED